MIFLICFNVILTSFHLLFIEKFAALCGVTAQYQKIQMPIHDTLKTVYLIQENCIPDPLVKISVRNDFLPIIKTLDVREGTLNQADQKIIKSIINR